MSPRSAEPQPEPSPPAPATDGLPPATAAARTDTACIALLLIGTLVLDLALYGLFLWVSASSETYSDFFALWSSALYAREHGLDGIYGTALRAFQSALSGMPYGYHP